MCGVRGSSSPAQTSLAPTWSQGREKGLLPGGNFTVFAPLSVAFPTPSGCQLWHLARLYSTAGDIIAGEECIDTPRPYLPWESDRMCPLDPGLSLA